MTHSTPKTYWLDRPGATNKNFVVVAVFAVLAAIPDVLSLFHILYETHPYTEIEEIPVFYGLYSLICFLTLLTIAKALQNFLKRDEGYYD